MSTATESPGAIDPGAVYPTKRAALLVSMHPKTLCRKIRAGIVKARGPHYRIKGSELLKLASLSVALFFARAYQGFPDSGIEICERQASGNTL